LHDKARYPPGLFRVKSNKILGYDAPVPFIMDFDIDPVNKPDKDRSQSERYGNIQVGYSIFLFSRQSI